MSRAATALIALILVACGAADGRAPDLGVPSPVVPMPPPTMTTTAVVGVVGDMGTGERAQYEVAAALCRSHDRTPLDAVVTTGDNVYQSGDPAEFEDKFFDPYDCLLDRGVGFRAAFGNHDIATADGSAMLADDRFGMAGRYYAFSAGPAIFIVLDSNTLGREQLGWLDRTLEAVHAAPWTVVVLHHPPHSGGSKHGSDPEVRSLLATRLEDGGVDLVLAGHEHLYSRAEAEGIPYVVSGGGGAELSPCASEPAPEIRTCASAHHFVLLTISDRSLRLRALAPQGGVIDEVRLRPRP